MGKTTDRLIEFLRVLPPSCKDDRPERADIPRLRSLKMDEELARTFWCFAKLRQVALGNCLDAYVSHTAVKSNCSDCTECPQGQWNRRVFASS